MEINIEEIKKLSNEEKLKIINELWESIEEDWQPDVEEPESPEVMALLEERLEKMGRGEVKFYSWEEVKDTLEKKIEEVRRAKNEQDGLHTQ
ncbi:MAG: addiction module protein [Bacteroidota bacterium]|nr:addiction module protein [Bacteroidota bacterium]